MSDWTDAYQILDGPILDYEQTLLKDPLQTAGDGLSLYQGCPAGSFTGVDER